MKRIAIAVLAAIALALSVIVIARHELARGAYEREARFGERGYSAARSDARYAEVRDREIDAARASIVLALLIAVIALTSTHPSRSREGPGEGARSSNARAWIAPVLDAIAIAIVLSAITALRSSLGAPHAAIGSIVFGLAIGACVGIPWSMLARGATPAMRLLRVRIEAPGLARAGLALALMALLLPIAPFAAIARAIRPSDEAPAYLRWLGLGPGRAS